MQTELKRREFLAGLGAAAGLAALQPAPMRAAAPTAPVAVAKCSPDGIDALVGQ